MQKLLNNYYQLEWQDKGLVWEMNLMVKKSHSHTKYFSSTYDVLKEHLPCILRCECENDKHIPFSQELKETEIGHLLEHILLEYLCQEKLLSGSENAEFAGRTYWNLQQQEDATFKIVIEKGADDNFYFTNALSKSLALLEKIFACSQSTPISIGALPQHN